MSLELYVFLCIILSSSKFLFGQETILHWKNSFLDIGNKLEKIIHLHLYSVCDLLIIESYNCYFMPPYITCDDRGQACPSMTPHLQMILRRKALTKTLISGTNKEKVNFWRTTITKAYITMVTITPDIPRTNRKSIIATKARELRKESQMTKGKEIELSTMKPCENTS